MKEKTVSESISFRRSVRVYDKNKDIDEKIVKQCIKLSTLAPNSSNLTTGITNCLDVLAED